MLPTELEGLGKIGKAHGRPITWPTLRPDWGGFNVLEPATPGTLDLAKALGDLCWDGSNVPWRSSNKLLRNG